jgi:anti-sigma factor RsiW
VSEHLSQLQIERYRQRRLSPSELLALDDHLTGCAACQRLLREMKPVEEAISALRSNLQTTPLAASDHWTREQLLGYAEGRLDEIERELAESHLEFCQQCSAQAAELRALAERESEAGGEERVEPTKQAFWRPAPASWRELLAPQFGWLGFFSRLRVASVILTTLLLAVLGALALRMSNVMAPAADRQAPSSAAAISGAPQFEPALGQVLLSLNDGGRLVTLLTNGRLTGLDELRAEYQQLAVAALTKGQVELPAVLSELRSAAGVMMGGGGAEKLKLIEPVGKIVFSVRPTLRWQALEGAESYIATVIDPKNNFNEVAKSPPLTRDHWQVDRALRRGWTYLWQVTATRNGAQITAPAPEAGDAKFKVLDQALADEIDQARKTYAGQHLIPGLLYARAGLLDEAVQELKALSAANPQAKEVKSLLKDLQAKQRAR